MNQWLRQTSQTLPGYINSLSDPSQIGKFKPCARGVTKIGQEATLGFSCFALKLFFILGLWDSIEIQKRENWINFINIFQRPKIILGNQNLENAFVDPVLIHNAYNYIRYPKQFLFHTYIISKDPKSLVIPKFKRLNLTNPIPIILAETKQAIATLNEIGFKPNYSFLSYPHTPEELNKTLSSLNWRQPWAAGGQAATFAVFITTQMSHSSEDQKNKDLIRSISTFFKNLADPVSGIYYKGSMPVYGQSINGAMKVLTALDWLKVPIHYPQQLIDTCLSHLPSSRGCHLVDAVYVLYRCLFCTDYRKNEIIIYLKSILDMIKSHYNSDGGFSYFVDRSQTNYYNIRIANGYPESDLHGTLLLTWAIAMILEIFEENQLGWRVLKP